MPYLEPKEHSQYDVESVSLKSPYITRIFFNPPEPCPFLFYRFIDVSFSVFTTHLSHEKFTEANSINPRAEPKSKAGSDQLMHNQAFTSEAENTGQQKKKNSLCCILDMPWLMTQDKKQNTQQRKQNKHIKTWNKMDRSMLMLVGCYARCTVRWGR